MPNILSYSDLAANKLRESKYKDELEAFLRTLCESPNHTRASNLEGKEGCMKIEYTPVDTLEDWTSDQENRPNPSPSDLSPTYVIVYEPSDNSASLHVWLILDRKDVDR